MVMQMIHMYDIKTVFILRIIKVGATAPLSVERKTNSLFVEIEKKNYDVHLAKGRKHKIIWFLKNCHSQYVFTKK